MNGKRIGSMIPSKRAVVLALLLGAFAAVLMFSGEGRGVRPAEAAGDMSLAAVNGPGDTGLVSCDTSPKPNKCTVRENQQFDITVSANAILAGGYGGFGSIVFLGGLVWKQKATCTDEVVWPDLVYGCSRSKTDFPGAASLGGYGSFPYPLSTFVGTLVRINVRCPGPGTYTVTLSGSYFDSNGESAKSTADSLLVNCAPEISLGATGAMVQCNASDKPTKCTAAFNPNDPKAGEFKITVDANGIPAGGYGGFQSQVMFGGLTWNQRTSCTNEVVWPNEDVSTCTRNKGPGNQARHLALTGSIFPVPASSFTGTLVELDVHCPAAGTFKVSLPAAPSSANGTAYRDLNGALVPVATVGQQSLNVNGTGNQLVDVADTLLINCVKPLGEMSLGATGGGVQCNSQPKPTKCTAYFHPFNPKSGEFQLQVHANTIPFGGYLGFNIAPDFGGLTWNQRATCGDEVVWPGEVTCDRTKGPPVLYEVSGNGSKSNYTGTLFETDLHCPGPGTFIVVIYSDNNFGGEPSSYHTLSGLVPITSVGSGLGDALTINCVKATPEVSLSAKGAGVTCDLPTKPTKCTAAFNPSNPKAAEFQINVNANVIPNGGYGAFRSEVFFGGLTWNQETCTTEVVWPDEQFCGRIKGAGGQAVHFGRTTSSPIPPFPQSNFVKGALVKLNVHCTAAGTFKVSLTAYPSSSLGTLFLSTAGTAVTVATVGQQSLDLNGDTVPEVVDVADTLLINCVSLVTPTPTATTTPTPTPCPDFDGDTICDSVDPDEDNDGCPDLKEQVMGTGAESAGGNRDYHNPYDYFDPTNDGLIRVNDILAVVGRYFSSGNPAGPLNTIPPAPPAYHPKFDRAPLVGQNVWNLTQGNGIITVPDILAVVVQYFHDCGTGIVKVP